MGGVEELRYGFSADVGPTVPQTGPIVYVPPLKKSNFTKVLAIIIAIFLILAGIGFVVATTVGNQAYIGWNVHSTHSTEYVDVIVYIDGEEVFSYQDLPPGYYCYNAYYYTYNFSIFEDSKLITIKAVSDGGWYGYTSDYESIIVYDGYYYDIDLYV